MAPSMIAAYFAVAFLAIAIASLHQWVTSRVSSLPDGEFSHQTGREYYDKDNWNQLIYIEAGHVEVQRLNGSTTQHHIILDPGFTIKEEW